MWLKLLIVILFVAILVSLARSAIFLIKDQGNRDRDRTRKALAVRVTLAVLLLGLVTYGVLTGELTISAPWHHR
jgi:hypothetical protein